MRKISEILKYVSHCVYPVNNFFLINFFEIFDVQFKIVIKIQWYGKISFLLFLHLIFLRFLVFLGGNFFLSIF